ncbi:MAG: hypothetical protein IIT39_07585 [Clostridia bacterium]|nr:hypothetical protein [Clostridia bacterium]
MNNWYVFFIEFAITVSLSLGTVVSAIIAVIKLHKKRKAKSSFISFFSNISLLVCMILFLCSHQHYYKYNDWFIMGNDIKTVVQKYGDFDVGAVNEGNKGKVGYYIYTDNGPIMPDHLPHYYYIHYDENGIVYQIEEGCAPGG